MNYKLTSVKILKDLYKKFKYSSLSDEFTLQKLVNRSMDLYFWMTNLKQQVNEWNNLNQVGVGYEKRFN